MLLLISSPKVGTNLAGLIVLKFIENLNPTNK